MTPIPDSPWRTVWPTDPRFMREAQVVEIRPSCVWAGGETLAVV